MNCPNCNHLITPGELICPACKARVAQMAQEEKLRDLAFEPVNKLKEFFSGKAFLVYSILLTVIAVAALADTFTFGQNVGGIFVTLNVTSVVVAIFALRIVLKKC